MEQKEKEELKKEEGVKEKIKNFFQSLAGDKIKCMYIVVLLLQIVFIILQFVPILYCTTSAKETTLFGEVLDVELINEKVSLCGFMHKESATKAIFWGLFAVLVLSVKNLLGYFFKKDDKRYAGLYVSKLGVFFGLGLYAIVGEIAKEVAEDYLKYGAVCQTLDGGTWYVVIAIALLICSFVLSALVKAQKEKDKIEAKVQEELKKQKEGENA